jgi:hypothetical protein
MTNFSIPKDTGDPGRTDDALDGIVDESAIHDEAIIAELLEADGQLVDRCVHAVRRIVADSCQPMVDDGCDPWDVRPWDVHNEITSTHRAVALKLLGRPTTATDDAEADTLDGEQGIACRLRPLPDDFAEYAHHYVMEACAVGRSYIENEATAEGHTIRKADVLAGEWIEQALHDFLDGLLDSWQISDIAIESRTKRSVGMYFLHHAGRDAQAVTW